MPIAHYQETAQKLYGDRIRVRVCGVCIVEEKILLVNHLEDIPEEKIKSILNKALALRN